MSIPNQPSRRDPSRRDEQGTPRARPDDGSPHDVGEQDRSPSEPRKDAAPRSLSSESRFGAGVSSTPLSPSAKRDGKVAVALSDLADCVEQLSRDLPRSSQADLQGIRKKLSDAREAIRSYNAPSSPDAWRGGSVEDPAGVTSPDASNRKAF